MCGKDSVGASIKAARHEGGDFLDHPTFGVT